MLSLSNQWLLGFWERGGREGESTHIKFAEIIFASPIHVATCYFAYMLRPLASPKGMAETDIKTLPMEYTTDKLRIVLD